jgi:hypothetical protein
MNGAYPIKYFLLRLLKFHSNDHILNEDEKVVQKEITDFINNIFLLTRFQSQKFNIRYKSKSKLKEVYSISFFYIITLLINIKKYSNSILIIC